MFKEPHHSRYSSHIGCPAASAAPGPLLYSKGHGSLRRYDTIHLHGARVLRPRRSVGPGLGPPFLGPRTKPVRVFGFSQSDEACSGDAPLTGTIWIAFWAAPATRQSLHLCKQLVIAHIGCSRGAGSPPPQERKPWILGY